MERDGHRVAAWCGRLLFVAAVLLGMVTMHTFGHAAHAAEPTPAVHTVTPGMETHEASAAVSSPSVAGGLAVDAHRSPGHGDGFPMDPLSVCLAVLGLGAAVLALLPAPGSDGYRAPVALLRAGLIRAPRPNPPPAGRLLLHRLSVLRV